MISFHLAWFSQLNRLAFNAQSHMIIIYGIPGITTSIVSLPYWSSYCLPFASVAQSETKSDITLCDMPEQAIIHHWVTNDLRDRDVNMTPLLWNVSVGKCCYWVLLREIIIGYVMSRGLGYAPVIQYQKIMNIAVHDCNWKPNSRFFLIAQLLRLHGTLFSYSKMALGGDLDRQMVFEEKRITGA